MKSMFSMSVILVSLLLIAVVISIPIVVIIAINTLFDTHIEITFFTWLATFFLLSVLRWISQSRSSKS